MYCRWTGRYVLFILFIVDLSCGSPAHMTESRERASQTPAVQVSSSNHFAQDGSIPLCERLTEIKELPFDPEERGLDPIYDAFLDAGDTVVPCLIGKITDTTSTRDPRASPGFAGIDNKVGDVAYFVLCRITKLDVLELLPPAKIKEFKHMGVYAYFTYVKNPENRRELQSRLYRWYQEKYGRDARSL